MTVTVRALTPADRAQWDPLWAGYRAFYHAAKPDRTTDLTWTRFHDPAEPMWAFGAFEGERMVGIVHMLAHRSTWTEGDYIYLERERLRRFRNDSDKPARTLSVVLRSA